MNKWYARAEIQGGLREIEISRRLGEPTEVIVETTNGRKHCIGYVYECGCELRGGSRYVYRPCDGHSDVPEEMGLIEKQVPKGYDGGVRMTNKEANEKLGWPTVPTKSSHPPLRRPKAKARKVPGAKRGQRQIKARPKPSRRRTTRRK